MKESRYEEYVLRNSTDPDPAVTWGRPELGIVDLHHFLRGSGPIKQANAMVEFAWVVKDSAFGVTEDKGPHKHDCPEIFIFMGTNPADRNELGGEIEFWIGEGEETEKIKINTSTLIWVPNNVVHLPVFFKNVRKPILWSVTATNIGDALKNTTMYPPRGV
jgi:hypothetical protein